MKILVEDIPREGLKLDFSLPPTWVRERVKDPEDDFNFASEIKVWVELYKSKNGVKVIGKYHGIANLICPKCLDPFQDEVNGEFSIRLMPDILIKSKRELRLSYKDLDIEYFDGVVIDLEQIILSELVVNFPHDKLCRDDCKGLCPVCGVNWNHETCEHMNQERKIKNTLFDQLKVSIKL